MPQSRRTDIDKTINNSPVPVEKMKGLY